MTLQFEKVDICNQALSYLGALHLEEEDLTTENLTTGEGQAAQLCNQFYDISLRSVINEFGWNETAQKLRYSSGYQEYINTFKTNKIAISDITNASPAVVTTGVSHNLPDKTHIHIAEVGGMIEIEGIYFINITDITTFQLVGINSSNFNNYTSGGTIVRIEPFAKNYNGFSYTLPDDLIFPIRLDSNIAFKIFRNNLVTLDENAILIYARSVNTLAGEVDLTVFNSYFIEALKIKLASNIAPRLIGITAAAQMKELMFQEYNIAVNAATNLINRNNKPSLRFNGTFSNRDGCLSYNPRNTWLK